MPVINGILRPEGGVSYPYCNFSDILAVSPWSIIVVRGSFVSVAVTVDGHWLPPVRPGRSRVDGKTLLGAVAALLLAGDILFARGGSSDGVILSGSDTAGTETSSSVSDSGSSSSDSGSE